MKIASISDGRSPTCSPTYDVVRLGDDSEGGIRLHVFGQPTDGGGGFSLMAVEATRFCQRGINEGSCV